MRAPLFRLTVAQLVSGVSSILQEYALNQCALRRVDESVSGKTFKTYGNNIALISLEEIVEY